jgi:hypothetical protein
VVEYRASFFGMESFPIRWITFFGYLKIMELLSQGAFSRTVSEILTSIKSTSTPHGSIAYMSPPVHTFASDLVFQKLKANYTSALVANAANWFNAGGGLASDTLGAALVRKDLSMVGTAIREHVKANSIAE